MYVGMLAVHCFRQNIYKITMNTYPENSMKLINKYKQRKTINLLQNIILRPNSAWSFRKALTLS